MICVGMNEHRHVDIGSAASKYFPDGSAQSKHRLPFQRLADPALILRLIFYERFSLILDCATPHPILNSTDSLLGCSLGGLSLGEGGQ